MPNIPPYDTAQACKENIERAVATINNSRPVVVINDLVEPYEGTLVFAADCATPVLLAFVVRHGSGFICVSLLPERRIKLRIPLMPYVDEDPNRPDYCVTIDAIGVGTGISAASRARTIAAIASPDSRPEHFTRPGHIVPSQARPGGVLERSRHGEAAIDLVRLAGRSPVAALSGIVSKERPADMAQGPELRRFAATFGLETVSLTELANYRNIYDI